MADRWPLEGGVFAHDIVAKIYYCDALRRMREQLQWTGTSNADDAILGPGGRNITWTLTREALL